MIEELSERFHTFVFSGQRIPPRAKSSVTECYHYGGMAAALGLSYDLLQRTHEMLRRET